MRNQKRVLLGGALATGAVLSSSALATAAVGDEVPIAIERRLVSDFDFDGSPRFDFGDPVGFETCLGASIDAEAEPSFRIAVDASCFDGFLIGGEGYGFLPDPVEYPVTVAVEGRRVLSPPELGVDNIQNNMTTVFDSSQSGCIKLVFEVADRFSDMQGLDLSCIEVLPLPLPENDPSTFLDPKDITPFTDQSLYPWCVDQIGSTDRFCFTSDTERQLYITSQLLGNPEYGTIWIGRFDEEVVAP